MEPLGWRNLSESEVTEPLGYSNLSEALLIPTFKGAELKKREVKRGSFFLAHLVGN